MKKQAVKNISKDTSWESVAAWYDGLLQSPDSYQSKVILPNLVRIVDPKPSKHIVELGCGQGYFSEVFAKMGASVLGLDSSASLIDIAQKRVAKESYSKDILFVVGDATNAPAIASKTADALVIVLALQNMRDLAGASREIARILKSDGKAIIVLNHPTFRVPQHSDWGFDLPDGKAGDKTGTQYRKIDKYLSEFTVDIDMHPGKKLKVVTKSFHRSLQAYMKSFAAAGLAITRIEEWISHRQSQRGPRQAAEDTARKEIPLFMCLELKKI